jgi:hypothetical protein
MAVRRLTGHDFSRKLAAIMMGRLHDRGQFDSVFMIVASNWCYSPESGHDHGFRHKLATIMATGGRVGS